MNALFQRLKEISNSDFEALINHLLLSRFPAAGITKLDGSGGDEGIDSFTGTLNGRIAIWQAKHFSDGIGKAQKRNILESIETAFRHHRPFQWTLCIPIDLNKSEQKWFDDKIRSRYSDRAEIHVFSASEIVFQLLHNRSIREAYFPDVVSDITALRDLSLNADGLTPRQKRKLGGEYIDQFIRNLEGSDPRFRFEVVTSGSNILPTPYHQPGLLASVFDGKQRVDVFARDIFAIQNDPIRLLVALSRDADKKTKRMEQTGRGESFSASEILRFELPPIIKQLIGENVKIHRLSLEPNPPEVRDIPTKVEIFRDGERDVYPHVPFTIKHLGSEEVTFVSKGGLPSDIEVRISLKNNADCSITVHGDFRRQTFAYIKQAIKFADTLSGGAQFIVTNLISGQEFVRFSGSGNKDSEFFDDGMKELVEDGLIVSEYLGYPLRLCKEEPSREDYILLDTLKHIATGEEFDLESVQISLIKDDSIADQYKYLLESGEGNLLLFEASPQEQLKVLFGDPINTGPMALQVEHLVIRDSKRTTDKYKKAKNGETLDIVLDGPSKARFLPRQTSPVLISPSG